MTSIRSRNRRTFWGRAKRDTTRTVSWLDSTQVAGAPTISWVASVDVDHVSDSLRVPGRDEKIEVERGVQFVVAEIPGQALRVVQPRLCDEDPRLLVFIGERPPPAIDVMYFDAIPMRMVNRLGVHWRPAQRPDVR